MVNESGAWISSDEKNDSHCADASVFCSGIGTGAKKGNDDEIDDRRSGVPRQHK